MKGLIVDLFAGGGGASTGIEAALGRRVDIAVNHSATALAVHTLNHPETLHLTSDVWEVDPRTVTRGRKVDVLWASPDCTHFSIAKGGVPREGKIRSLAWVVRDWARDVRPAVIFLENVQEFLGWGPLYEAGHVMPDRRVLAKDDDLVGRPIPERKGETFSQWRGNLELLGYRVEWRVLSAAHFGAPTSRRRLFLVARCDGQPIHWPEPTHGPGLLPFRSAAECIDWNLPCPSIFERKKPLAEKTLRRIAAGIRRFVLENPEPFVMGIDHQSSPSAAASARAPLSTITAKARHALVAPSLIQTGYGERPGQRPRYLDLHEPLGTVVAKGQKHALVSAFLAKHYGGVVGVPFDGRPLDTITAQDHHSLAAATLVKLRGECHGADVQAPLPTVTASGTHLAEVRAFLTAYYGTGIGQELGEPLRTITAKHRLGLVTVAGTEYQITDIGMRMLEPHELLRAQFGRFAEGYDLSAATTKAAQVRLIGNSVCPEAAEAVVAANLGRVEERVAA